MNRLCDMSQRIRIAYERADELERAEGADWYPSARRFARSIASHYGYTLAQAAGVVAALSPRQLWNGNKTLAERALRTHKEGFAHEDVKLNFTHCNVKAWAILNGARPLDVLRGPKVRSFYRNIMGDPYAITVDVWAWRVCRPDDYYTPTPKLYSKIVQAYRNTANRLELEPSVVQATTWIHTRNRGG